MERKRILLPSWKETLAQKLNQSKPGNRISLLRTCFMGVGNDLRGDDSAGLLVARALLADKVISNLPDLLVLEGGSAPENHTGKIRAFQPEFVLIFDAAHMEATPGAIQWIPLDSVDGMSASSHSLPLSVLAHFLKLELGCDTAILGIQPDQNGIGGEITPFVRAAVNDIVAEISNFFYLSDSK